MRIREFEEHIAARKTAPSPLAGEGITDGRSGYSWVRGTGSGVVPRRPLTRLRGVYHRAALCADPLAKPPSPTRGEGKKPAIHIRQAT
jgi:hypothetical protein